MKSLRIVAALTLAVVALALVTATAYAYMGGRIVAPFGTYAGTQATQYGSSYRGMMGGGMMGGYVYYSTPQTGTPSTPTTPYQGGWGCGGNRGSFGSIARPDYTDTGTQIEINTAVNVAQDYITATGNTNLVVTEVEEYTQNFYVIVKEKDTGIGAFELIVDKYTRAVGPEMGPNMMWNTKYSMHNGMMGYFTGSTTAAPITLEQVKSSAQQYLSTFYPLTSVGDVEAFYGYSHVEVMKSGEVYGMLSVNSYTGQVWYHTWHGAFVQEIDLS
jgi:hypothetical protein